MVRTLILGSVRASTGSSGALRCIVLLATAALFLISQSAKAQYDPRGTHSFALHAAPSKYRKVALDGRPLPDSKPQQAPESDSVGEQTYIDAFDCSMHHSTTDIHIPLPGSDLVLEVRRSTQADIWFNHYGLFPSEMPDRPFGAGWSSNLCANIHFVRHVAQVGNLDPFAYRADYVYVTDLDGEVFRFLILKDQQGTDQYFPVPAGRNEQESYLSTLTASSGQTFVFTRKFGTTLTFQLIPGIQGIRADRVLGQGTFDEEHTYGRLLFAYDRTGTVLTFNGNSNSLIPDSITARGMTISIQKNGGLITSVTDPAGRTYNYDYEIVSAPNVNDLGDMDPNGSQPPLFSTALHPAQLQPPYQTLYSFAKLATVTAPATAAGTAQVTYTYHTPTRGRLFLLSPNNWLFSASFQCHVKSITDPVNNTWNFVYAENYQNYVQYYLLGAPAAILDPVYPDFVNSVYLPGGGAAGFYLCGLLMALPDPTNSFLVALGHRGTFIGDAVGNSRMYEFTNNTVYPLTSFNPYFPNQDQFYPLRAPYGIYYAGLTVTSFSGGSVSISQPQFTDPLLYVPMGATTVVGTESFQFDLNAGLSVVSATDMSGNTTTWSYSDPWTLPGFLAGTSYAFGAYADPTSQVNAFGKTRRFTYAPTSRFLLGSTDETGRVTTYTLDSHLNRTKEHIVDPRSGTSQTTMFTYSPPWFMTSHTSKRNAGDPAGITDIVTTYTPDSAGRVATETVDAGGGQGLTPTYTYDEVGNKKTVTDPRGNTTTFDYDERNRLIAITYPMTTLPSGSTIAAQKTFTYDLAGRKLTETDENGTLTAYTYDGMGRVTRSQRYLDGTGDDIIWQFFYTFVGSKYYEIDPVGMPTAYQYDALQRLTKVTDANGKFIQYFYDGPNAGGSLFETSSFHPTSIIDKRGFNTTYTYDKLYRKTSESTVYETGQRVTTTEYDEVGRPTKVIDPLLHPTTTTYDVANRSLLTTYADATSTQNFYSGNGLHWKIRDERGFETETSFDGAGRPIATLGPAVDDGSGSMVRPLTQTTYDPAGNVIATIDPLGNQWDISFDARNRKLTSMGPAVTDASLPVGSPMVRPVMSTAYDAVGNAITVTDPRGFVTSTFPDRANRPVEMISPAVPIFNSIVPQQAVTTKVYDAAANVLRVIDPNGHLTTNVYDNLHRLQATQDPAGNWVSYTYDENGNRLSVRDGLNQTTNFAYDGLNRNTQTTDPFGISTTFTYNVLNKTKRTDGNGNDTLYTYDPRNRLLTIKYPSRPADDRNYSYDESGNLLAVSLPNDDGTRDASYVSDALRRVISETSFGLTHTYAYDLAGRRLRITFCVSGSVSTSTFDALGRTISFSENGRATTFAYDLGDNLLAKTLPDGEKVRLAYDGLKRTSRIDGFTPGGGQLYYSTYEYDLAGNTRHIVEYLGNALPDRTVDMAYDDADRLTFEWVTTDITRATAYLYDFAGNRWHKSVDGAPPLTLVYNALNQLTLTYDANQVQYFTYDANGNRISKVVRTETDKLETIYHYDVENRLTDVVVPPPTFTKSSYPESYHFAYDHRTRRVLKQVNLRLLRGSAKSGTGGGTKITSTWQSYSGGLRLEDYTETTTGVPNPDAAVFSADYLRAGPELGGGTRGLLYSARGNGAGIAAYKHYNHRGDVVAETNASGTLNYAGSYLAFGTRGAEFGSSVDAQRANTKEEDETGLLNEGMRYRDLDTGVFLTRDPLDFVDGPNLYSYVRQNPWTKWDPTGLLTADEYKARVAAARQRGGVSSEMIAAFVNFPLLFSLTDSQSPVRIMGRGMSEGTQLAKQQIGEAVDTGKIDAFTGSFVRAGMWFGGLASNAMMAPVNYAEAADQLGTANPLTIGGTAVKGMFNNLGTSAGEFSVKPSFSGAFNIVESAADICLIARATAGAANSLSEFGKAANSPISNPGPSGFVLVGEGPLHSTVPVPTGSLVNRVFDSEFASNPAAAQPLGSYFEAGGTLPPSASTAISTRGLGMRGIINNAQLGAVYRANSNIPALSGPAAGGTGAELIIGRPYFKNLELQGGYVPIQQ